MPALVAFGRRWRVGSDDFVFPAAGAVIARAIWLIVLAIIFAVKHEEIKQCEASKELQAFFIGVLVVYCLIICNECIIVGVSMRGSVMNTRPRKRLPLYIYMQLFLYVPELAFSILGTYWAFSGSSKCEFEVALVVKVTVILQWLVLLGVFVAALVLFDPLGSKAQIAQEGAEGTLLRMQAMKKLWERRCKFLCYCFVGREEHRRNAYAEIAELLAAEFVDVDAVPSDVLVGLILLQNEHKLQEHQKQKDEQHQQHQKLVNFNNQEDYDLVHKVTYFMKYSLGSYGWPLYMYMNICCGCCSLCPRYRCCGGCCLPNSHHIQDDNCCLCNTAALEIQSGLESGHLLYTSFHNELYQVPFFVAVDHVKKAVVVSIRGSLSLKDAITDMTASSTDLEIPGVGNVKAHKGILKAAEYVKQSLEEKNILDGAFADSPDYQLIIVGHSLGAGTASLLSVLLKPTYPGLQCFAYSNPSVVSEQAAIYSEDFTVSVVLGKDMIPRMSLASINELRQDLTSTIRKCSMPKYRILMTGCWRALCFFLGQGDTPGQDLRHSVYRVNDVLDSFLEPNLTQPLLSDGERSMLNGEDPDTYDGSEENRCQAPDPAVVTEQLYPSGRILQIDEFPKISRFSTSRYKALWGDRKSYTKIAIASTMITDHFPDAVAKALNWLVEKNSHPENL